jgi:hypothetical protein
LCRWWGEGRDKLQGSLPVARESKNNIAFDKLQQRIGELICIGAHDIAGLPFCMNLGASTQRCKWSTHPDTNKQSPV